MLTHPDRLKSAKEAVKLKHIGPKIVERLERQLEKHLKENGRTRLYSDMEEDEIGIYTNVLLFYCYIRIDQSTDTLASSELSSRLPTRLYRPSPPCKETKDLQPQSLRPAVPHRSLGHSHGPFEPTDPYRES